VRLEVVTPLWASYKTDSRGEPVTKMVVELTEYQLTCKLPLSSCEIAKDHGIYRLPSQASEQKQRENPIFSCGLDKKTSSAISSTFNTVCAQQG
jgi:hypothetical protein